ncbi:tRNA-dihydrouridine(47) synthase [NAD(P)(+)] [Viridothelium virens]|uniref:tRNA-dihydrouridine(47) synthase [NAD(P)(+)] n=1 Tax=Viridothelium virens TaxID=1048519 RepID=A0A6A6GZD3_VIRVR|nr:tRNA-dihydrouridine(47) synthase [NAD(P)(+)] [Viridothelium virens]
MASLRPEMAESDSDMEINVESQQASTNGLNPLDQSTPLKRPPPGETLDGHHPQSEILPGDSATTQAEKLERHGPLGEVQGNGEFPESSAKRVKTGHELSSATGTPAVQDRRKGVAPIKPEFLLPNDLTQSSFDDDAAEASTSGATTNGERSVQGKRQKSKGQNTSRNFGSSRDALPLCSTRKQRNEFSPEQCTRGEQCRFTHDLRKYLKEGKRQDLDTFGKGCPVFAARGWCHSGWTCRFVGSHSKEVAVDGGRTELVLLGDNPVGTDGSQTGTLDEGIGVVNIVGLERKTELRKRKFPTPKSDAFNDWLNTRNKSSDQKSSKEDREAADKDADANQEDVDMEREDNRALYKEPPFRASEKRKLYYGPETPMLAPLTTQGNLPFRRLCVELGAQATWSEMAMGLPLIQGERSEWALLKAHESETKPPQVSSTAPVIMGYDNSKDLKFGAQIAGNKPWLALKATEVITSLCPHLRAVDLNCGCPIDLVYRQGAGSALLDSPAKLEKILRGMNAVSGEVPITVKIRMGTKDNKPTAYNLVERLVLGGKEATEFGDGPAGVAAVTLHGRSRQQRYTRLADWNYISECAALVNRLNDEQDNRADTTAEPDARDLPASNNGKTYFVGNGDSYSYIDYYDHIQQGKVDTVMLARGALIKPWLFEEISAQQYLDKSATERLAYIEKFAKYGLEAWGSDEIGVGNTRRFLLEWLNFTHRYVPEGLLEVLPPKINERPPAYKGRNELETLLASENYKDWIKISEMFLGPAHKDFHFEPKHKSNSFEIEAEG